MQNRMFCVKKIVVIQVFMNKTEQIFALENKASVQCLALEDMSLHCLYKVVHTGAM